MQFKKIITLLLFFGLFYIANGQKKGLKYNTTVDIGISPSKNQFAGSLAAIHLYGLGKSKKFKIGYGLRYSGYFGNERDYITAPAKLTSGKTGPLVLFSEIDPNNYDTLRIAKSRINSFNASINLQYSFSKKMEVGFNIDAIGITFGKKQTGVFSSSDRPSSLSQNQEAKPTPFNFLLISDNDIGSLNSELYGKYWLNDKIAIKGGITFLFTEYTTTNKLVLENDRWRNKSLLGMIGIAINPFKNQGK